MDLETYIKTSSSWLIDCMMSHDLAEAALKTIDPDFQPPERPLTWEQGPVLVPKVTTPISRTAFPLVLYHSKQMGRAEHLIHGQPVRLSPGETMKVPLTDPTTPRAGGIIARAGIITQFELWRDFVAPLGYPFNRKRAKSHEFADPDEQRLLLSLIDTRNEMTHEPALHNDPDARRLVDYTNECHHMARWAAAWAQNRSA